VGVGGVGGVGGWGGQEGRGAGGQAGMHELWRSAVRWWHVLLLLLVAVVVPWSAFEHPGTGFLLSPLLPATHLLLLLTAHLLDMLVGWTCPRAAVAATAGSCCWPAAVQVRVLKQTAAHLPSAAPSATIAAVAATAVAAAADRAHRLSLVVPLRPLLLPRGHKWSCCCHCYCP
jgi:hypothetical protein